MTLPGDNGDNQIPNEPEQHADRDDEYERAMRRAMAMMEKGFNLGGPHTMDRKALRQTDSH